MSTQKPRSTLPVSSGHFLLQTRWKPIKINNELVAVIPGGIVRWSLEKANTNNNGNAALSLRASFLPPLSSDSFLWVSSIYFYLFLFISAAIRPLHLASIPAINPLVMLCNIQVEPATLQSSRNGASRGLDPGHVVGHRCHIFYQIAGQCPFIICVRLWGVFLSLVCPIPPLDGSTPPLPPGRPIAVTSSMPKWKFFNPNHIQSINLIQIPFILAHQSINQINQIKSIKSIKSINKSQNESQNKSFQINSKRKESADIGAGAAGAAIYRRRGSTSGAHLALLAPGGLTSCSHGTHCIPSGAAGGFQWRHERLTAQTNKEMSK